MVSIKEATKNAIAFAMEALGPKRTTGIRLEEVESTTVNDDDDTWLITLSMIIPIGQTGGVVDVVATLGPDRRAYKIFTVSKRDGEVLAMKIRELASV